MKYTVKQIFRYNDRAKIPAGSLCLYQLSQNYNYDLYGFIDGGATLRLPYSGAALSVGKTIETSNTIGPIKIEKALDYNTDSFWVVVVPWNPLSQEEIESMPPFKRLAYELSMSESAGKDDLPKLFSQRLEGVYGIAFKNWKACGQFHAAALLLCSTEAQAMMDKGDVTRFTNIVNELRDKIMEKFNSDASSPSAKLCNAMRRGNTSVF